MPGRSRLRGSGLSCLCAVVLCLGLTGSTRAEVHAWYELINPSGPGEGVAEFQQGGSGTPLIIQTDVEQGTYELTIRFVADIPSAESIVGYAVDLLAPNDGTVFVKELTYLGSFDFDTPAQLGHGPGTIIGDASQSSLSGTQDGVLGLFEFVLHISEAPSEDIELYSGIGSMAWATMSATPPYIVYADADPLDGHRFGSVSSTPSIVIRPSEAAEPADCNGNGKPDDEEIAVDPGLDCDGNGVPDECDPDLTLGDCPANLSVYATDAFGAVVSFPTPAAQYGCNAVVTVEPPSGSLFPIGATTVTVTATDETGARMTCSFEVSVLAAGEPPPEGSETGPGAGSESEDEPESESADESGSESEAEQDAEAESESEVELGEGTGSESAGESASGSEPNPESESEPESGSGAASGSESEAEPQAETGPGAASEAESGGEPTAESAQDSEADLGAEDQAQVGPGPFDYLLYRCLLQSFCGIPICAPGFMATVPLTSIGLWSMRLGLRSRYRRRHR
ncbi:MAG: HYR domain-containing protein [Phycisphaerae bacterium]|nr:HYR domain-containing protein [Phycisphaerae bacterium]